MQLLYLIITSYKPTFETVFIKYNFATKLRYFETFPLLSFPRPFRYGVLFETTKDLKLPKSFTNLKFVNLNNITRHSYIAYSRPNGWTDWAEIFCEHSLVAEACHRLKKSKYFFFKNFSSFFQFFFQGQRRALQLVITIYHIIAFDLSNHQIWLDKTICGQCLIPTPYLDLNISVCF